MFSLQGNYKVDVYTPQNELVRTTDYVPNFITSTGLSYPYTMPFVDTFKYMSIGSGTDINTVDTTGLALPHHTFTSMNDYVKDSNGTIEVNNGVQLYRAWNITGLDGELYQGGVDINEIGVSPNPISGGASGALFSRIVLDAPVNVPSGNYSILTYRLDISMQTGVQSFSNIINTSQVNATDDPVCRYWDTLSGKYSLIHHGLKTLKSNGTSQETDMKPGMEPSIMDDTKHKAYLSTDNQQFTLNPVSGGKVSTGIFKPWNENGFDLGQGVCQFQSTVNSTQKTAFADMRRGSIKVPDSGNFRNEKTVTAYEHTNNITTITPDAYVLTGRTRSLTRLYSWPNTQNQHQDAFGNDYRLKSLVVAYKDGNYFPIADMQFASSGLEQNFSRNTGAYTYDGTSITGDYVFVDPYDNLSLSFTLGWSAPCPSEVSGCPGWI